MIHPDDRHIFDSVFDRLANGKSDFRFEYRIIRPDGDIRHVEKIFDIIKDADGNPVKAIGAVQDITDRKLAEDKLRSLSDQLRALSARLRSIREEEGSRISRELHDELGGTLSTLKWELEEMAEPLSSPSSIPDRDDLRAKLEHVILSVDGAFESVRRLASELRPTLLDEFGLVEAIKWHSREFEERTGIKTRCDCPPEPSYITAERATAVFRIVQEALTNVLRHSGASEVVITLAHNSHCWLTVRDNGRGITDNERSNPTSLGLLGMRERVALIGGEFNIEGSPGKGTTLTVAIPREEDHP
jgi:two-component system sensor histidine kinase UhpB